MNMPEDTSKEVLAALNRWIMPRPGAVEPPYFDGKEAMSFLERFEELREDFCEEEHHKTHTVKRIHSY